MQVRSQSTHRCNLGRLGANNLAHGRCGLVGQQLPLRKRGILEINKVPADTDGRPCVQLRLHVLRRSLGLETE